MDTIPPLKRSANMKAIRNKNTDPEIIVRRLTYGMGYRYRIHSKLLPGKPDLFFISRKKVIFVHGCFWHQHKCKLCHTPKSNLDYWFKKLNRTIERDFENEKSLFSAGWGILVIWECETKDTFKLSRKIKDFLEN